MTVLGGRRRYAGCELVPACSECNTLLGSLLLTSVEARAAYLAGKLEMRYRKLLKSPKWTEEELEEVGPTLRSTLRKSRAESNNVRQRIAHCLTVAS